MFRAIVNVYAVPKPKNTRYYFKDWSRQALFSCLLCVDPEEGDTEVLKIQLRNLEDNSLIAVAPYDGRHGIASVADSAQHFVLIVRNHNMHAWLGVEFSDSDDSTEFSLAIQTFMRRRMFDDSFGFSGWPTRETISISENKV